MATVFKKWKSSWGESSPMLSPKILLPHFQKILTSLSADPGSDLSTSSYLVHQLFGSALYIWKQKWVPLSSETRRTPESAPVRHHEFHLRSIWLNISLKLFDQHININHTTLMKQSLKFSSLEDLSFPPKCAPQSALLTELLKQPLLNILLNQIRSFLSLLFSCSNI